LIDFKTSFAVTVSGKFTIKKLYYKNRDHGMYIGR